MKKKSSLLLLYGLPLFLAALLKSFLWSTQITPFNADEAIVALMARHINQGQYMAFFYGQAYMGSLDAMLVSLGFSIFGEQVWVIRLVQSILYLGTVATTVTITIRLLGRSRTALYAGLLTAVPTVNVALYTTVSLGGYGEMLLIGNLLFLGGFSILEIIKEEQFNTTRLLRMIFIWGLGAGLAFWVLGLTLVYTLPILVLIIRSLVVQDRLALSRGVMYLGVGGLVGAAPWWVPAVVTGNQAIFTELIGGAIAGVSDSSWWIQPINRAVSLVIFGGSVITGIRPPWSISWLMLPLLPFALVFWMAVLLYSLRKFKAEKLTKPQSSLVMMGLVLSVGFILSPYGDDPSGRYFLPFLVPMSVFGAEVITGHLKDRKYLEIGLVGFMLVFNLGGIVQSAMDNPPGLTTQFDSSTQVDHTRIDELIGFLRINDITTGYSNYWVSYPLSFLSQEELIFVPRLPYHNDFRYTSRDDRYPPYSTIVASSSDLAYITTRHPELDEYLVKQFLEHRISWQQKEIGDYTVYYQLSEPVYVTDIGLGITTKP